MSLLLTFQAAGNSFTSGPHAAVAVGVAGESETVAFLAAAQATAAGVVARQISIVLGVRTAAAVGIAARLIQTQKTFTASAVGVVALTAIATFLASAAAVAIGVTSAASQFFAGGSSVLEWGRVLFATAIRRMGGFGRRR